MYILKTVTRYGANLEDLKMSGKSERVNKLVDDLKKVVDQLDKNIEDLNSSGKYLGSPKLTDNVLWKIEAAYWNILEVDEMLKEFED